MTRVDRPRQTVSTPISRPSTNRSRPIWFLSQQRRHAWMRSPASGRSPPRSFSPRSAPTCHASRPPGTCVHGPSFPPALAPRPARPTATAQPGTATRAIVAVGRSILVIVWHLIADEDTRYTDLGSTTSPSTPTPTRRNATTSANLKHSATPSPSPQQPDRIRHR